ncbi:MAG: PHB depolymerase family esterase [Roseibacillus sp.]|nr:PHB depolymerase family esterase [Roseibacillus sp.]
MASRLWIFIKALAFLVLSNSEHVVAQDVLTRSVRVDGSERQLLVYLPENFRASESLPVLLCFHGGDDSAEGMMRFTADFRPLADSERFIAVYPQGLIFEGSSYWNSEGPYDNGTDEIGFARAMIDLLVRDYAADPTRVYACGFSLGGNLMRDLACYLGDQVAAVASVAASMWEWTLEDCSTTNRTGILSIHGTEDSYNPYNGNQHSISINSLNTHWASHNGANKSPITSTVSPGVTRYLWDKGDGCHTVEHYRIQNGPHSWPSFSKEVIWEFVSRYNISGLIGCGSEVELVIDGYNPKTRQLTLNVRNLSAGNFEIRRSSTGSFQSFRPRIEINQDTVFPLTIPSVPRDTLLLQIWERP